MVPLHASSKGRILRFGVFEADLAAGEIRKNGLRVRLQEQPFQLLALLLTRPGELVSREELRHRLWAADTFVDFDHSLNTAVKKIREALGDTAANPRYVETVARRGYRFLLPVQGQLEAASEPATPGALEPAPAMHSELEVPLPHRGLIRALFVLIQIMYLAFYVTALLEWQMIESAVDPFLRGRQRKPRSF
jgi:DNA-binding winged helix-turn-helix (wHTH) protein